MTLPPDFQFSQASLQDFVECRRRFQLRYLLQLEWPAAEAEPIEEHEQHMLDGATFHRLIHQHRLGIPAAQFQPGGPTHEDDGPLSHWWAAYLATPPLDLPELQYPELALSVPLGEHRLVAKLDLLAIDPGRRAVIVDWKTSRRQSASWLGSRLQTRVYRYVVSQAAAHLNDGSLVAPEQIRMVYWYATDPEHPETLLYDAAAAAADARYLAGLVDTIAGLDDDDFPKTDDARRCRFCPYRSLCNRGIEAGLLTEEGAVDAEEPEPEFDWERGIDFEQIAEIAF
jgi:CRISPR/Cas system-associated exonuclease Cas4 (RecB family)